MSNLNATEQTCPEDQAFREECINAAKDQARAAGLDLDLRLLDLCERYFLGELNSDEFGYEIVKPHLH